MSTMLAALALREEIGERLDMPGVDAAGPDSGLRLTYVWVQMVAGLIQQDPPRLAACESDLLDVLVRAYDADGYTQAADVVGPVVIDKQRAEDLAALYVSALGFAEVHRDMPANGVLLAAGCFEERT